MQRQLALAAHRRLNAHRRHRFCDFGGVRRPAAGEHLCAAPLGDSWDAGVVVFLALTWWMAQQCPADEVRATVLANDQGRRGVLTLVLLAIAASIAAIFFLLQPKGANGGQPAAGVAVAVLTIVCSWLLTHVMFALHYAHRFYRDDPGTPERDATGGLRFPGDASPYYWDFLYFSFVIGMTSQVSDVQVTSRPMRQLVLLQASCPSRSTPLCWQSASTSWLG